MILYTIFALTKVKRLYNVFINERGKVMSNELSQKITEILSLSKEEATRLRCRSINPEHLLLGIIRRGNGSALDILGSMNINIQELKETIERANEVGLTTIVCADSMAEAGRIAGLAPDIIVAEPSELIGTGVSVGREYVEAATSAVKDVDPNILVLTAAGIANGEDVYNTIIAGADATGSSSGVAKAADRAAMVDEMIAAVRRAWDERHSK